MNQNDSTIAQYRQAVRLQPDSAEAHNRLGIALAGQGQWAEAVACFREAVRLLPDFAGAYNNLGNVLAIQGDWPEAAIQYGQAVRLKPDHAQAHNNLAAALATQGRCSEAITHYRQAVRLKPDYAEAHKNLGTALLERGEPEAAVAHYQQAIRFAPKWGQPYFCLAHLAAAGRFDFPDGQLRAIEAMLADKALPPGSAADLHFALALLAERHGRYDEAFAHCRQANDLQKRVREFKGGAFDRHGHRGFVDRLMATCDRRYAERVGSFGLGSELPVFVVGMPRSGTTLVEQILASHPQVVGAGELPELERVLAGHGGRAGTPIGYPEYLPHLDPASARALGEQYVQCLRRRAPTALRVVDKLPKNFMHLGAVQAILPQARVIHCGREPLDACLSCYMQNFEQLAFTNCLEDLGFYFREYERLMAHWRSVLRLRMYEVHYEDLVARPEAVIRELVAFCGLDWDDRCLHFHEHQRVVQTASTLQVRRPLYGTSVGRWQRYAQHLGPLRRALGQSAGRP